MGMKDILVHVNVSKHCPSRLEIAAHLAQAFDAHLTGLYTSAVGDVQFFMMEEMVSNAASTRRAWWAQMRDKRKVEFDALLRDSGVAADWIEVENDVAAMVPYHARYADLTIVGQIDPGELLPLPEYNIPEDVALASGRPALVVPYAGSFATVGRRVLIGWNGSAQSARAVNDAFPFLRRAEKVTILTVNPDGVRKSKGDRPGAQIAAHLSRHGIKADARELSVEDVDLDDAILSQASDDGADLIVMGAYGHARAREIVLGGATRALFKGMTVPILISH
jgi:nucleotide-binding universal stress UspA family protein